jgi:hypothetical protein
VISPTAIVPPSRARLDLGPTDTNGVSDVYIGTLSPIPPSWCRSTSQKDAGRQPRSIVSGGFSADGTRLAFGSLARDLVPVSPSARTLYVRDLATGTTTLVSVASDGGVLPGNGAARTAALSADGTRWYSSTSRRTPRCRHPSRHFARTSTCGTHGGDDQPVSRTPDGGLPDTSSAAGVALTGPQSCSRAPPATRRRRWQRADRRLPYRVATGAVELVSTEFGAHSAAGASGNAAFSADGSVLGFTSSAPDVVSAYPATGQNLYVRHIADDTTELVSLNDNGDAAAGGVDTTWRTAADGATIAYSSSSKTLDRANPTAGTTQVYAARGPTSPRVTVRRRHAA